jgi:D-3-phosphoglycerate dehydrogenase
MTKKNILICERFSIEALMQLKQNKSFNVESYTEAGLATANALIIRSKFKITAELLDKTPNLELVVTCTSGFDHIDLDETQKRNITVMYTPDANVVATAEMAWTLIMAANRKLTEANKLTKSGTWNREMFTSNELAYKTLGIIGLGRIGSRVAKMAKAFDMNVVAFDPYLLNEEAFTSVGAMRSSYEEVLRQADIISFHVPLTKETKQMFNSSHLECTGPGVVIINTSRGGVVHEEDLILALNNGEVGYAALDVFAKEPLTKDSKLLKTKNLIVTPHLGAYTEQAFLKASLEAATRTQIYFENKSTQNTLPLKSDWANLTLTERT